MLPPDTAAHLFYVNYPGFEVAEERDDQDV